MRSGRGRRPCGGVFVERTVGGGLAGVLSKKVMDGAVGSMATYVSRVRSHFAPGRMKTTKVTLRPFVSRRARGKCPTLGADGAAPLLNRTCHSYDARARMYRPLDFQVHCDAAGRVSRRRRRLRGDSSSAARNARRVDASPRQRGSDIDVRVSEGRVGRSDAGARDPGLAETRRPIDPARRRPKTVGAASSESRRANPASGRGKRSVAEENQPRTSTPGWAAPPHRRRRGGRTADRPWTRTTRPGVGRRYVPVRSLRRREALLRAQGGSKTGTAPPRCSPKRRRVCPAHFPTTSTSSSSRRGLVEYLDLHMEPHPRSPSPRSRARRRGTRLV